MLTLLIDNIYYTMSFDIPVATYQTITSPQKIVPIQIVTNLVIPKLNNTIKKYPKYKKVGSSSR